MGDLLHLHDAHEQAQMLLPWHVNGTLEPAEAALFKAHLAECAECRGDLAENLALREQVAGLPVELELGPARSRLLDRLGAVRQAPDTSNWNFLRRRIALGWTLAGSAALAASAAALIVVTAPSQPEADYQLLGSLPGAARGNVIVLFAPGATERDMRSALEAADGRMVDGPTASGAWMVQVADTEREQALDRLRRLPQVILAEPIDAGDAP